MDSRYLVKGMVVGRDIKRYRGVTALHLRGFTNSVVWGFRGLLKQNRYCSVLHELSVVLKQLQSSWLTR